MTVIMNEKVRNQCRETKVGVFNNGRNLHDLLQIRESSRPNQETQQRRTGK
jgi:hypothetical protein